MAKRLTARKSREILRHGEVHGEPLTSKQRRFFGAVAGGQMPKHRSPDTYNDTSVASEAPPRVAFHATQEVGSEPLASAAGRPAGVRVADGTESPRVDVQTKMAGDGRAKSSPNKRRQPGAVDSYSDSAV